MIAETKRLILQKFTIDDAHFYKALVNTPNWIKYIGDRNIKTLEKAKQSIKEGHLKSYSTNGYGFYKLLLKGEHLKPIGTCGLVKRDTLDHPDIGFALLPEYERKGFGLESSIAVLNLAKTEFKIKTVFGITLETNKNSVKLLEKLGLTFEKRIKPFDDDEELLLFAKNL